MIKELPVGHFSCRTVIIVIFIVLFGLSPDTHLHKPTQLKSKYAHFAIQPVGNQNKKRIG